MSIIKLVNEEEGKSYDTTDSIYGLIYYIFDGCKTLYDENRPGHMIGDFLGCAKFLGSDVQEIQAEFVSAQMTANNSAYDKTEGNLMKHRVISFSESDFVLPNEAFQLARYIANAYGEDYITAYGVHLDTNNIHIHLAVNTIGWRDGRRFDKSFEKKWLWGMVNAWDKSRESRFLNNPKMWEGNLRYYGTW